MNRVEVISSAVLLFVFIGAAPFGYAQHDPKGKAQSKQGKQAKPKKQKGNQQQEQKQQQKRAQQQQGRLPQQRQQQLIQEQQQRLTQYRWDLDQERLRAQDRAAQLQQQGRTAQYRFQADYLARLQQQQVTILNERDHDYNRDAYFYTAPNYRYRRGGRYYETNQYGANVLRQAVNYGYREGLGAGQADRQDGGRADYLDSFIYRDANYGYAGYYVTQDDYNYYFREGFRRGYDDGYNGRYRYGRRANGTPNVVGAILSQILGLQSIR